MTPIQHTIISTGVSIAVGTWTNSWEAGLASFLSGILIDLDHIFDYVVARKKMPDNLRDLDDFGLKERKAKLYLFFHS